MKQTSVAKVTLITVCKWVRVLVQDPLFCRRQHSGRVQGYSELDLDLNVWQAHSTMKDTKGVVSRDWSQHSLWLQSVNGGAFSTGWIVLLTSALRKQEAVHLYSQIRSRSNVWKEHPHNEGHKNDQTHFLWHLKKKRLVTSCDCLDDSGDTCDLKKKKKKKEEDKMSQELPRVSFGY